jgi:hypothetical protein
MAQRAIPAAGVVAAAQVVMQDLLQAPVVCLEEVQEV